MKKLIVTLVGFLIYSVLGACNASSTVTEIPVIARSTGTKSDSLTSTTQVSSTVDSLTPTAIAQFITTQEATITVTHEASNFLTYEDCGSNWASMTIRNWTLCDGLKNPITIMNMSGKTWLFYYDSFYDKDVKDVCTRLHYITRDESYLYFSLDTECELIEPGFVFSVSMFRMNLLNGEVTEVLKANYDFETHDGDYYSVSVSPTGRRLAYIYHQKSPLILNIVDLQMGENRSFHLEEKYRSGGMFSWSEDGTKLVFMLESEKDYDHFISMVFLDLLRDDSMVTFIKDQEFIWISSRIEVMDKGVKITSHFDTPLFYDVETGILSPID